MRKRLWLPMRPDARARTSSTPLLGLLAVAGGLLLGLLPEGCAEVQSSMRTGEPTRDPSATSAPHDLQLLDALTAHHQQSVELSRLAPERAAVEKVRSMANRVQREDMTDLTRLQGMRIMWFGNRKGSTESRVPGAEGLSAQDLSRLRQAQGPEFDDLFIQALVTHNRQGIAMATEVLNRSARPALKTFAQEMLTEKEDQIALLEQWQRETGIGGGPSGDAR